MKTPKKIKQLFKDSNVTVSSDFNDKVLFDAGNKLTRTEATPSVSIWRTIMKSPITKLTVAACVIIAIIIGFSNFGGSGIAFADVLQKIQGSSYTFDLRIIDKESSNTTKVSVLEPGKVRMDGDSQMQISSILDVYKGKSLILFHQQKAAMFFNADSLSPALTSETGFIGLFLRPVQNLWNLKDGTEKEVGEKEIEGRKAKGFKVFQEDNFCKYEITIWADAKTSEPILVEVIMSAPDNTEQTVTFLMDNFKLNAKPDESLFSTEVPAGYTLGYQKELDELDKGTKTTSEAEKIEKILELWSQGKKNEAIEILLSIDWSKPFAFSKKPYIFTITEKGYISLKAEIQQQVMTEVSETGRTIWQITIEVISLGQQAMTNKDYLKAEKHCSALFGFGKLITRNADLMLASRLIGIAVKRKTLNELVTLYTTTNKQDKLQEAKNEIKAAEAEYEQIRQKAIGQ